MEIKGLRIGNNVFFDGKVQEISSIHSDNTIRLKENKDSKCHGCYKVNRIEPIPLTEEVLLKFNILRDYDGLFILSDNLKLSLGMDNLKIYFNGIYHLSTICGFVHVLQNFYHSIYSEELTYSH